MPELMTGNSDSAAKKLSADQFVAMMTEDAHPGSAVIFLATVRRLDILLIPRYFTNPVDVMRSRERMVKFA